MTALLKHIQYKATPTELNPPEFNRASIVHIGKFFVTFQSTKGRSMS